MRGNRGWSGDVLDAAVERVYLNGKYVHPSEVTTCPRCSLRRRYHRREPRNQLCRDCRAIEQPSRELVAWTQRALTDIEPAGHLVRDGLIWRWVNEPEPEDMTADDWAWCRAQETAWKRQQAERANRRDWWTRERQPAQKGAA